MRPRYLLGIDAGGGAGRCLLVDVDTAAVRTAARSWTHPRAPGSEWSYDLDTARCRRLLAEASRELLARSGASAADVLALSVTSMRHALVLVGRDGRPLAAMPNRDARASDVSLELAASRGERMYARTGRWPIPIFLATRLRWLREHAPDLLDAARAALAVSDWLNFSLCGEICTDLSQAGESLLLDLASREWAWDLVDELDIPRGLLPPLRPPGTALGALSAEAGEAFGLRPGIPVVVGGADTQCGLLGTGTLRAGEAALVAGTTAPLQAVVDRLAIDPDRRVWTGLHAAPGLWVLECNAGPMGETLEWLAGLLYPDSRRPVARLLAEAGTAAPGSGGFISTLGAQVFDAARMGLPVGNLTLSPMLRGGRRPDLARSIVEGLGYSLRANVEQIATLGAFAPGPLPAELKIAGGLSRSETFCRLLGEVLGVPVAVSEVPESSALGAAISAGVGVGVFRDFAEGAERLVRLRPLAPEAASARTYDELYADWQRVRLAQADGNDVAAEVFLGRVSGGQGEEPEPPSAAFRPTFFVTAQFDESSLAGLRELGDVRSSSYREALQVLTGDDLVAALQGVHVFITEVDVVDLEALQRLPDLRVLVSCRGQAVNVDTAACTALGIPVLNSPGRNADAVADLAVAFMLMLGRKLAQANAFLREPGGEAGDMGRMGRAYAELVGAELVGRTVGLVGLGAVGRTVARRLAPFRARILVYDPFVTPEEAALADAEAVPLERLLEESDVVSLHAAVTDATRGLLGEQALARMKRGAFLVNTARAALVDEEALHRHLVSGHLGGAALDVFSAEPPASSHPLLALSTVLATPHVGGNTLDVATHQGETVLADIRRLLAGERPLHVLNPETLKGFSWTGGRRSLDEATLAGLEGRSGLGVSDLQREAAGPELPATPAPEPARTTPTPPKEAPEMETSAAPRDVVAQLERVIDGFCAKAVSDATLTAFAAKRRVITHYTLSDVGIEFHVGFESGTVIAGRGAPPRQAEVRMKAATATLDAILTGRLSGNKAAMSGKLAFSGDVRLAMGLQRIQGDMVRLYSGAREEAGGLDPAELARLALPTGVSNAPAAASASGDPREELVSVVQELYQAGLVTATGGNVSVRVPDREEAWITPSQLFKGTLRPEVMVRIDLSGNALDQNALAPSSERVMHTGIYRARPDVHAVVHAHAPYTTILGMSGKPFLPITTDAAFLGEIPRVPFIMPGSRDLAEAAVRALGKGAAVILQNHGLLVASSSLRQASNLTEAIERTAQIILGCYAAGRKPPSLPRDVVQTLREIGQMMA